MFAGAGLETATAGMQTPSKVLSRKCSVSQDSNVSALTLIQMAWPTRIRIMSIRLDSLWQLIYL